MKLFRFLKSKTFIANVVAVIIVCALLFWGLNAWLDSYTRHGDNIKVPNLQRLSFDEATEALAEKNLNYSILDTSEFNPDFPRGAIIGQYPGAGSDVKEGREIRLTLNRMKPRKIAIPDLIEKTKRRALYDLRSTGFEVKELEYVPYLGEDVVVEVKVNGRSVDPGDKFDKGTAVTLVLGQGLGDVRIKMPYLRWLTFEEARQELLSESLNLGSVRYDEEVEDSAAALVYRQYPNPSTEPSVNIGAEVDLWLTTDHTKIPNDSLLYSEVQDTTLIDTANVPTE